MNYMEQRERAEKRAKRKDDILSFLLFAAAVGSLVLLFAFLIIAGNSERKEWIASCKSNGFEVVHISKDMLCVDEGKTVLRYSERSQ